MKVVDSGYMVTERHIDLGLWSAQLFTVLVDRELLEQAVKYQMITFTFLTTNYDLTSRSQSSIQMETTWAGEPLYLPVDMAQ